jgi:fatty-acyl-CoA synthase
MTNVNEQQLERNSANHTALTPLHFIERAASVHPEKLALVHGTVRRDWRQTYARCRRLASALQRNGFQKGETISIIAPNTPEMFEAHFGVPMAGTVLNTINIRLDAEGVAFILQHADCKLLLVDQEFVTLANEAVSKLSAPPQVITIEDSLYITNADIDGMTYERFIATGDPEFNWEPPQDEWETISLNYTSGTTGNPKGVVYHHRGAALNAINNTLSWDMSRHPVYLWTLPMFHCNGWCFPWTIAALAGTNVCLRQVEAEKLFKLITRENVGYFCAAPIVLNAMINCPSGVKERFQNPVKVMTAGAAPPDFVIQGMQELGAIVTHTYGLTETYGPSVVCEQQSSWDAYSAEEQSRLKARQGVRYPLLEGLIVAHRNRLDEVPWDGDTIGEIMMRGNVVMKGYLKNRHATEECFDGGWFRSGDLAVRHPDGYIEIKDRAKDIIISGGENISGIEIENVLYRHNDILEAAVVAKVDKKWGEVPCAFVLLKNDAIASEKDIIEFCKERMASFKAPKKVIFSELPKTSTGKVQKNVLRTMTGADLSEA